MAARKGSAKSYELLFADARDAAELGRFQWDRFAPFRAALRRKK